jgi:hypothetical protein
MCFFIAKGGVTYCRRGQIEVTQLIKIALIDGIVLTSAVEQQVINPPEKSSIPSLPSKDVSSTSLLLLYSGVK